MAISRVNAADLAAAGTNDFTANFDAGDTADRILFVAFAFDPGDDDITSVTYNGVAMTLVEKNLDGMNRYVYRLAGPAADVNQVRVQSTDARTYFVSAAVWDGAHQSSQPAGVTNSSPGNATSLTTSVTPAAADSWIMLFEASYNGNPPPGAGTGATKIEDDGAFGVWGLFDSNGPQPASAYSMTTTRTSLTDRQIGHIAVAITQAGGGGSNIPAIAHSYRQRRV